MLHDDVTERKFAECCREDQLVPEAKQLSRVIAKLSF